VSRLARMVGRITAGGSRTLVAGLLLAGAMVAVVAVGQQIANRSYHRAAVTEVARIGPASRLLTDMLSADESVNGYLTTLDPFRLLAYQESSSAFTNGVDRAIRASGDAPAVQAQLHSLSAFADAYRSRAARALQLANVSQTIRALRVIRGALNPFRHAHARLMATLQSRRLDAVREADRWSNVVLGVSIAAVVLGCLALALIAGRRPGRGPLQA
jgi:CHASE3 domain sensor protein